MKLVLGIANFDKSYGLNNHLKKKKYKFNTLQSKEKRY